MSHQTKTGGETLSAVSRTVLQAAGGNNVGIVRGIADLRSPQPCSQATPGASALADPDAAQSPIPADDPRVAQGGRFDGAHGMTFPPEMSRVTPVIHEEADETRNRVAATTSAG